MKRKTVLVFLVVLVIFSGCSFAPKFKQPEVKPPESFRYDSLKVDTVATLKWWELFDDPQLKKLIEVGLENNKDVRIAAARVEQARATHGFNKADLFPSIHLLASASRGDFAFMKLPEISNNFYVTPRISWELDFWGKFRNATKAAKLEYLASEFGMRSVQVSLISEIATTYYLLMDYRERLEIARKTLKLRDDALKIIQERFNKGVIPEIDLNQAQIQKAVAQAAVPFYERLAQKTENALSVLLGQSPGEITTGKRLEELNLPPEIPPGLPATLLQRRPDIVQQEQLVRAQLARVGVAQAMRLPSISLTGLYGLASSELTSLLKTDAQTWSLGGNLLGPLFQFGKNLRRVDIEKARAEEAVRQYEKTILQAFREVEDALVDIRTLKEELVAREEHFRAAKNAERLSRERYDKGVTSYLEVIETQRSAFDAELALSQTRQQLFSAYVNLYKVLGGGWISEAEEHQVEAKLQKNDGPGK